MRLRRKRRALARIANTPRPFIQAIVSVMKPDPRGKTDFRICDPACDTDDFLVWSYEWQVGKLTTDFTDNRDEVTKKKSVKSVVKISHMKHDDITKVIIGAGMAVLNELKLWLYEKLCENALVIELAARGHKVEQQREYPVQYRAHFIGKLVPDLFVDGKMIGDPKVVSAFNDTHRADAGLSEHHRP